MTTDTTNNLLAAAEALLAAKDNQMETIVEWRALRAAVTRARGTNAIPDSPFQIGQRVCCEPLGEDGHIVGYEDDLLIIDLVSGGTAQVPGADCSAR